MSVWGKGNNEGHSSVHLILTGEEVDGIEVTGPWEKACWAEQCLPFSGLQGESPHSLLGGFVGCLVKRGSRRR